MKCESVVMRLTSGTEIDPLTRRSRRGMELSSSRLGQCLWVVRHSYSQLRALENVACDDGSSFISLVVISPAAGSLFGKVLLSASNPNNDRGYGCP